ncbi:hypothetical protein VTK73DRAFT_3894 [Phialemonium thermophilum]|uniref:Uncharacterized protein n=1 Tax=Phialemonium thermophilum TaxID=223376 RepID=A0ABR3VDJ5_9PEZI
MAGLRSGRSSVPAGHGLSAFDIGEPNRQTHRWPKVDKKRVTSSHGPSRRGSSSSPSPLRQGSGWRWRSDLQQVQRAYVPVCQVSCRGPGPTYLCSRGFAADQVYSVGTGTGSYRYVLTKVPRIRYLPGSTVSELQSGSVWDHVTAGAGKYPVYASAPGRPVLLHT